MQDITKEHQYKTKVKLKKPRYLTESQFEHDSGFYRKLLSLLYKHSD